MLTPALLYKNWGSREYTLHGHASVLCTRIVLSTTIKLNFSFKKCKKQREEHLTMCTHSEIYHQEICPGNVYPLEPHFYITKLGYAGVYLLSLLAYY